jgi:deazaflavin-dependent oxidoreductase (nitroreductase family)
MTDDPIGRALAERGDVLALETIGRSTGRPVVVHVGFVRSADDAFLVAAGSPAADWVRNLQVEPRCRVRTGEVDGSYVATELDGPDRATAIRGLILRYGTPAERLGAGPAFRLAPTEQLALEAEELAPEL